MATCVLAMLVTAAAHEIDWHTVDGGGGTGGTGGPYTLSGTAGQPDARSVAAAGGNYTLRGGFWVIPECAAFAPADYDRDCDVDQGDYALFETCASGADVPLAGGCDDRDFDTDGDVDQADFAVFQGCLSGENHAADAQCAG